MTGRLIVAGCLVMASVAGARADCLSDFSNVNKINASAGPYEISGRVFIAPTATATPETPQTITTVQVAPPTSFRVRMRAVDIIVTGNTKGWIKSAGASWVAIPPDKLPELMKDAPLQGYFAAGGLSDLQCRGIQVVDGKPRLTFTYNAVIGGRKAMVSAYFDPDSRRPVAGESVIDTGGTKARTVTSYTFDRAIRIAPPAP
ncbi:hypothetical protein FHP25_01320 [Vineibacter terrae]|uniref:Uncharacterized protein n=1 Tax=Vineibacter terrae TaxID=2586908 RepID=A0A5C8PWE9_9HYPH|nr:hypothetical protein [Vineibacter terrae]TXL82365.1 hypothetical protein FHP25_01320 [Vineibacter terrae]